MIRIKNRIGSHDSGAALACLGYSSTLVLAGYLQAPPAAAAVRPLTLPISLLDVMRASVEIPADGIWAAEGADKLSEDDWQLADQDAVNLIAATTLIATAGTGKNDAQWVANADWQAWVRDMQKTAVQIRSAVKGTGGSEENGGRRGSFAGGLRGMS